MRASRLVNLLLLLQTRGGMTAAELGEKLEVSVRTIYRDVDALSEAGVPIYAERGPHGGVRLVDGYRTRLTGLTEGEAEALFLSGLPGPASELGLGTVVAAARLKVLAALPPELRTRASRITERFHLDAPSWFRPAEQVPHLSALAQGVWENRFIDITYTRTDKVVERRLEPLGLVLKGGIWYLVARHDDQVRTYRVSRVTAATLSDEHFERPHDFDLSGFWAEATAAYAETLPSVDALLTVDQRYVRMLADCVGEPCWVTANQEPDAERPGWVRVRLRLESIEDSGYDLLRLGPSLEVLEPAELRASIIDSARRMLERYAPAPSMPA